MKRDMDLVRTILLHLQKEDEIIITMGGIEIEGTDYSSEAILYHLTILADSPYVVEGNYSYRLTWQGHELLDSIADQSRWGNIKKATDKVGGFTFEIIGKVATEMLTKAMSGQLNI